MGRKLKNYEGLICGCWKVIERDRNPISKSHDTFWISECQNCGNIVSVRKTDLDREPKSCNKCKGNAIRETMRKNDNSIWKVGEKYGFLTIIDKGDKKDKHTYVTVQCDCGSEPFEVRLEHLKGQSNRRKTISCGCATETSGEIKIRKILEEADINFQKQYRIKNKENKVMIFDFVIFDEKNNIIKCIEYDGEQHFKPIEYFGGEENFKKQKERDERKNKYCEENNIALLRIPYFDYDKIDLNMLLAF